MVMRRQGPTTKKFVIYGITNKKKPPRGAVGQKAWVERSVQHAGLGAGAFGGGAGRRDVGHLGVLVVRAAFGTHADEVGLRTPLVGQLDVRRADGEEVELLRADRDADQLGARLDVVDRAGRTLGERGAAGKGGGVDRLRRGRSGDFLLGGGCRLRGPHGCRGGSRGQDLDDRLGGVCRRGGGLRGQQIDGVCLELLFMPVAPEARGAHRLLGGGLGGEHRTGVALLVEEAVTDGDDVDQVVVLAHDGDHEFAFDAGGDLAQVRDAAVPLAFPHGDGAAVVGHPDRERVVSRVLVRALRPGHGDERQAVGGRVVVLAEVDGHRLRQRRDDREQEGEGLALRLGLGHGELLQGVVAETMTRSMSLVFDGSAVNTLS